MSKKKSGCPVDEDAALFTRLREAGKTSRSGSSIR
jgi:hypothetical protein